MSRFDGYHNAIMFISTKNFSADMEEKVKKAIEEELKKELIFVGRCFGRFDLVVEFKESSAKVASNKVCEIQENITKKLRDENDFSLSTAPMCSSLMLCNELLDADNENSIKVGELPTLKLYSFLSPKESLKDLDGLLKEVKKIGKKSKSVKDPSIYFSSSTYTFLLTVTGDVFCDVFESFQKFRDATKSFLSESCTYISIGWNKEDEKCKDGKLIKAYVFTKLKEGFGELNLNRDSVLKSVEKRFGWSDSTVIMEAPTLKEIKLKILELRESHDKLIQHTSTLLVPEKNGDLDERNLD